MKYYYCLLFMIFLLNASCTSSKTTEKNKYCDMGIVKKSKLWIVYYDTAAYLIKGAKIDSIKNDYSLVINAINNSYAPLKLEFEKIIKDTLYVKIDSSVILTQRMGTFGAETFEAVTVFSLTENKTINCIYLDFEEGDHGGSPGFFVRKDFEKDFIVKECIK